PDCRCVVPAVSVHRDHVALRRSEHGPARGRDGNGHRGGASVRSALGGDLQRIPACPNGLRDVTPIRVLELRSVRGTGGGPEKTILAGAARSDPARFAVTVCYIRDQRDGIFALDKTAADLGVDYVEVRERHSLDRAVWPE